MEKLKRRSFLKTSGNLMVGSLLLSNWACQNAPEKTEKKSPAAAISVQTGPAFGIQLYTLRDVLPDNPKKILKALADMGYRQIESYEGPDGMFWGQRPRGFKEFLDKLGMRLVASHCDVFTDFDRKVDEAAEAEMDYLICPWLDAPKTLDAWKAIADQFNELGARCQENDIRFAYHNHGYPFVPIDGVIPYDYLLENTDPELVDFELDIFWAVAAQVDPIQYFEKYPGRIRLCHVKDRKQVASPEEKEVSVDLGTGGIDFPKILKAAQEGGMEYFILEQEDYEQSTPMECARIGAEYLQDFDWS